MPWQVCRLSILMVLTVPSAAPEFQGKVKPAATAAHSDLYVMGFRSELTVEEYERESGYRADAPVPDDVAAEQARLDAAGVGVHLPGVVGRLSGAAQGLVQPGMDSGVRLQGHGCAGGG
jgi:hypothetical protein